MITVLCRQNPHFFMAWTDILNTLLSQDLEDLPQALIPEDGRKNGGKAPFDLRIS